MAANVFIDHNTDGYGAFTFTKPVDYLNVNVEEGVLFEFSLDGGENFVTLPAGFHSFRIGPTFVINIRAEEGWQLLAVQA